MKREVKRYIRVRSERVPSSGASVSGVGVPALQVCGCVHQPKSSPSPLFRVFMEISSLSQD